MTHTPGPWTVDVSDQGDAGHGAYVAVEDGQETVARVICYDRRLNDLPYRANARLIAAAPDLLQALISLVQEMDERGLEDWVSLTDARAAIAKATGAP